MTLQLQCALKEKLREANIKLEEQNNSAEKLFAQVIIFCGHLLMIATIVACFFIYA